MIHKINIRCKKKKKTGLVQNVFFSGPVSFTVSSKVSKQSDQSEATHVRQGCFQLSLWVCCSLVLTPYFFPALFLTFLTFVSHLTVCGPRKHLFRKPWRKFVRLMCHQLFYPEKSLIKTHTHSNTHTHTHSHTQEHIADYSSRNSSPSGTYTHTHTQGTCTITVWMRQHTPYLCNKPQETQSAEPLSSGLLRRRSPDNLWDSC